MDGNASQENGEDRLPVRWVVIGAISAGVGSMTGIGAGLGAAELFDPQLCIPLGVAAGVTALLGTAVKLNKIVGR